MTNLQAIDLLKGLEQSLDDYCELNDEGKTAFRMGITALELFGNAEQLTSAQPEQKWIPCSERLPEQYGNYLVSIEGEEPDIGTINPNDPRGWSLCDANGFYWASDKMLNVIAWMPLPEPYKERREE